MIEQNHECYVSLEVAKLLKESGFDWKVNHSYPDCESLDNSCSGYMEDLPFYHNLNDGKYGGMSAPTLDEAQRWLREEKDYYVFVTDDIQCVEPNLIWEITRPSYLSGMCGCSTYEDYLEAGIKKALELILEKGE